MSDPAATPDATETPDSAASLASLLRNDELSGEEATRWIPVGGGTKPALSAWRPARRINMRGIEGVVQYDPSEYTITVRGGTRVDEVQRVLAEHGQTMPFDPPRAAAGATMGGVLATGWSGPGRWRFGGIRDFLLAVEMVDGTGTITRTGAAVVKNAAGFDLPKLMIGSAGRLGIITELSLKVFPAGEPPTTWAIACEDWWQAAETMGMIARSPWDVSSLECLTDRRFPELPDDLAAGKQSAFMVCIQIAGPNHVAEAIVNSLRDPLAGQRIEPVDDAIATRIWQGMRDWSSDRPALLIRVPVDLGQDTAIHETLDAWQGQGRWHHVGLGGNVLFLGAADDDADSLREIANLLDQRRWTGMVIESSYANGAYLIGHRIDDTVYQRVRPALDPQNRFADTTYAT